MSTDQPTLADFSATSREDEEAADDRPAWTPGDTPGDYDGPRCRGCGKPVTADYARVFGDNDNVVHGCQDCGNKIGNERNAAGLEPVTGGIHR